MQRVGSPTDAKRYAAYTGQDRGKAKSHRAEGSGRSRDRQEDAQVACPRYPKRRDGKVEGGKQDVHEDIGDTAIRSDKAKSALSTYTGNCESGYSSPGRFSFAVSSVTSIGIRSTEWDEAEPGGEHFRLQAESDRDGVQTGMCKQVTRLDLSHIHAEAIVSEPGCEACRRFCKRLAISKGHSADSFWMQPAARPAVTAVAGPSVLPANPFFRDHLPQRIKEINPRDDFDPWKHGQVPSASSICASRSVHASCTDGVLAPQWPYTGRKYHSAFAGPPMQAMSMGGGFDEDPSSPHSGPPNMMQAMPPNFSPYGYRFAQVSRETYNRAAAHAFGPSRGCHLRICRGRCSRVRCSHLDPASCHHQDNRCSSTLSTWGRDPSSPMAVGSFFTLAGPS